MPELLTRLDLLELAPPQPTVPPCTYEPVTHFPSSPLPAPPPRVLQGHRHHTAVGGQRDPPVGESVNEQKYLVYTSFIFIPPSVTNSICSVTIHSSPCAAGVAKNH